MLVEVCGEAEKGRENESQDFSYKCQLSSGGKKQSGENVSEYSKRLNLKLPTINDATKFFL